MEQLAALASIGNLYSQMAVNEQNWSEQHRVNSQNREFQREIIDENRRNYLQDREYNSPAAMMQRLTAAGLNKNLLSGGQFTGATTPQAPATGTPSSVAARKEAPQIDPLTFAQTKLMMAEARDKEADADAKEFENSEEQRGLRTSVLFQTGLNIKAVARQNITKADIDEALRWSKIVQGVNERLVSNAETRAKIANIYYDAIMKYGKDIADEDYANPMDGNENGEFGDFPDGYNHLTFSFAKDCLAYIEKRLKDLELEDQGYQNRLDKVDAEVAERTEVISTASPFLRLFMDLVRMLARRR